MFAWFTKMESGKKKCLKYAVKVSVAYQFIVAFMYVVLNRVHTVSTVTLTEAQPWGEMLCTYASSTALWAAPTLLYQILTIITRFRHFWFHASYGRHTDKLSMVLQLKKKKKDLFKHRSQHLWNPVQTQPFI